MTAQDSRHIVITGAGRGLGKMLADRLSADGVTLYISARDVASARATASLARSNGATAHAFHCDLGDPDSIARFAQDVAHLTAHVDVVINNGAPWLGGDDIEASSDLDIVATLNAGALGTVLMSKHFMPLLRRSPAAQLVFVVSTVALPGHVTTPAHPAFYAAKHAVAGLAEILSARLRSSNVHVAAVYPGTFYGPDEQAPLGGLTAESVCSAIVQLLTQRPDSAIKAVVFED